MRKLGIVIISIGLTLSILFGASAELLYNIYIHDDELENNYQIEMAEIAKINYNGIAKDQQMFGFEYTSYASSYDSIYGLALESSELFGLQSYEISGHKVSYEVCAGSEILLNVYFDGVQIYSAIYMNGDHSLDMVFSGETEIDYVYDQKGNYLGSVINESDLVSVRGNDGKLQHLSFNGKPDRAYQYQNGILAYETVADKKYEYEYEKNGFLISSDDNEVSVNSRDESKISVSYDGEEYTYVFGHKYNGNLYVTDIYKDGTWVQSFCYINDKVVAKKTETEEYVYILDNSGNHVGFVVGGEFYLFVYDGCGNVFAILNSTGEAKAFIDSSAYGEYQLLTNETNTLRENCVLFGNAITDTATGFHCLANGIVIPQQYKKITLEDGLTSMTAEDSFLKHQTNLKLEKLPAMLLFEEMIIDDATTMLANLGLAVAPYVEIVNEDGNVRMTADLYTLDYSEAQGQVQNIVNGNQAYKIIYEGQGSWHDERMAECKAIMNQLDSCTADYYGNYAVRPGSMVFGGQFVYLGYLVTYVSDGNGIISYSFAENIETNYRIWNNVYNYDTKTYANYSEVTFSPSLWDYTTIIPGMNREQYAVVENALNEIITMESVVIQEQIEYLDNAYSNVQNFNEVGDTLDLFENISEDEMLVLADDGNICVQYLPFEDSPGARRSLLKIGGTVIAIAAVGLIACSVPGCQFLIPIFFGAVKGAIYGLTTSVTATIFTTMVFQDWDDWDSRDWETLGRQLLNNAANDMVNDAFGGARNAGFKMLFQAGANKIVSAYKTKKLAKLDAEYPYYLRSDSMQAAMEYNAYKLSIESRSFFGADGVTEHIFTSKKAKLPQKVFNFMFKTGKKVYKQYNELENGE